MADFRIGIDLGGTKIEGIVLDAAHRELYRQRISTEQEKGYDHILGQIKNLYRHLAGKISGETHTLGVGTPGSISRKTGLLKNSNTVCLNGRPLKDDMEKIVHHPLTLKNDANCFALAESVDGAGNGHELVFGVIMGTGCGGGIVYRGEILEGRQDIAGEWGHVSIDPKGPPCYCGNQGCVETLISGRGLERLYAENFGRSLRLREIVKEYREGGIEAGKFMKMFFRNFGRAMASLINILDPDVVILGGGVSNIDELYTEGVREVEKKVFSDSLETPIVKNKLGDSAGVLGAALIGI